MKTSNLVKIGAILILALAMELAGSPYIYAVEENLDEMFARKVRRATATWNASYLENSTTFIWQPETLMYKDVTTGHEAWKLSDTPGLKTYYQKDVGVSPWSADGKKMAITGWSRADSAYYPRWQDAATYQVWYTVDTSGDYMRPTVEAGMRVGGNYFHWSQQIPGVWYEVGDTHYGSGAQSNILYKSTVSDNGVISRQALVTLPPSTEGGVLNKLISADGKKAMIYQWHGTTPSLLTPLTIWPDNQARVDLPTGYSVDRGFGMYGNMTGGPVINYHGMDMAGLGDWYFATCSGTATNWHIKTLGSAPDGGALYTGDDGNHNFGEVVPENHGAVTSGNISSPWVQVNPYNPDKTSCWSHLAPDRWGRHILFSNVADNLPGSFQNGIAQNYGPGVWDMANHRWAVPTFGGGAQHHDWHGFTDWTVSSRGAWPEPNYLNDRIYSQKYDDPNSQLTVAYTHTLFNNGGTYVGSDYEYNSLARPGQSPDGTKVAWHSTFLNVKIGTYDDKSDIFWSVVMYPYPPTNLTASTSGGVKISFLPPKYTERRWINPATGKIDEVNGEELFAREIKQYHVWRSTSQTSGWQEIGVIPAEYANDQITNTLKPKANGNWVSSTNKFSYTDNPRDGTCYYALTSEEHSGLESDQLSEILQVGVSGGQVTSSSIVAAKGQKDFWKTTPARPSNFTYNPTVVPGHYRLNWTEPNDSKVRFYNIYYSTLNTPQPIQQNRIASLPKGQNTYLDWLADTSKPGYYAITSVDRYGNESPIKDTSRHITAANLDTSNQNDELIIDFGQNGIWTYYTTTNTWNTLHPIGSESIIRASLDSDTRDELVLDFDQYGIWIYSNSSIWTNLHNINPDNIIRADIDSNTLDELVVDFGQYGIWVYSNNSTWSQLHTLNPDTITRAKIDSDSIDELVIDFGQEGIWVYYPNIGTWTKLHTLNPESIISAQIDSNPKDDLVIDFGTNGIWIIYNNSTWVKLHTLNPDYITKASLDSNPIDDLVIDFGTNGIWIYFNNNTWVHLHTINPESITRANLDSDTKDDLVLNFSKNGIWIYYNNNTWVKMHD